MRLTTCLLLLLCPLLAQDDAEAVLARMVDEPRAHAALRPALAKAQVPLLERLHARAKTDAGKALLQTMLEERRRIVWFEAKTFDNPRRLAILEYLVCPVPGQKGVHPPSYECLCFMSDAEWRRFRKAYAPQKKVLLRWGDMVVPLSKALPWAKLPKWNEHGLNVGGNHDERKNKLLPPDGTKIYIGLGEK